MTEITRIPAEKILDGSYKSAMRISGKAATRGIHDSVHFYVMHTKILSDRMWNTEKYIHSCAMREEFLEDVLLELRQQEGLILNELEEYQQ